ncbi:MAG: hypothetical protein K2M06_09505 [Muribaculaceae bacterium]|nr:hypothetical protein [Muribaculaceae bacterium]
MKKFALLALGLLIAGTAAAAAVPEIPAEKSAAAASIPREAQMLQVAAQLVKYGYAEQEALPLIQAADIYESIGAGRLRAKPTSSASQAEQASDAEKAATRISFDPERLLAAATEMAGGDPALMSLIKRVRLNANRGATRDYMTSTEIVRAGATDTYTIEFRGGELALAMVTGDGDTDLDLFVYDSEGNLVDSDTDDTDECLCSWVPEKTAEYTIIVKNYGKVYNCYSITVN